MPLPRLVRHLLGALGASGLLAGCAVTTPPPATPPAFTVTDATPSPLAGQVFEPASGRFVPVDEALARLAAADFVLLGERHDHPDHHALQAFVLDALVRAGRRPALVLEMVDEGQEAALAAWKAERGASLDALAQALDWSGRGWPSFSFYAPLFATARAAGLAVVPGNWPLARIRTLVRSGPDAVPEAERAALGLDRPLPAPAQADLTEELRASHCGMLPETLLPGMAWGQRARDGRMARALADTGPEGGVLIAGSGHTRRDRAVPWVLGALAPGRSVLALAFAEVPDGQQDPRAVPEASAAPVLYDLVWFTPPLPRPPPCP
ncbi:ChaN family lipoprotein [Pararhodospirillum oryzae]|uniref:Haem-binding uptake Tiki superfamily ChaN domain-containing protein n=1 Tax=Pararhodospirillum oryzae TaxID=478448 RepID=A0A512H8Y1_9PROT|nr:ChaN family lipoprotein [Pararhodospirillum oryzae]GEO81901.1 hypothetical protein ROR02_20320 [Pararhodospirillum oryzae]